ncbi:MULTISPECIES: GNAT family N-acetyltransferase [Aeromonas]|uniref:GNAT family N-acetyltransferase n=1 Tax=Aeromonas TaxID=642 RepID=UPI00107F1BAB|nr:MULTISPECIES: GNAT family N-acetyltransferase [Aeromonas]QGZ73288.1 GNAT family N-acetyltransferase [Aeromonas hydrophila]QPR86691.1 GNAT family N-acetyltransferase [Aeromonas hydrophila]UON51793.1 GNAT family N-acetyltransferase [Aeromonas hydrophila]
MEISLLADSPHEVSTIVDWYFDEWASHVPGVTKEMVRRKVESIALNRNFPFSLVAHDDRELVGTLELKIQENKNHPEYEFWIGGVYVPAAHRRKGIAKKMINVARDMAVSRGVATLYLQCETHNVDFYREQGFNAIHESNHGHWETTIMVWHAAV